MKSHSLFSGKNKKNISQYHLLNFIEHAKHYDCIRRFGCPDIYDRYRIAQTEFSTAAFPFTYCGT